MLPRALLLLPMTVVACHCDGAAPRGAATASSAAGGASTASGPSSTTAGTSATGSTAGGGAGGGAPAIDFCSACSAPAKTGVVGPGIDETSGLAASRLHPGVVYLHNDSGDAPRFFALDASGADQGVYTVTGAVAIDWEDMTLGPCPAGSCLYLGDVGDNAESRSSYTVYRVPEPKTLGPGEHSVAGDKLEVVYPDGSHNCETLLAHPASGELYLVTKTAAGPSGVYRFPKIDPAKSVMLEKVGEVTAPMGSKLFTGGDIHPGGAGVLLRTYTHLWYYSLAGVTVGQALATAPCALPQAFEQQGEAVTWKAAGDGYVTISEGAGAAIYAASCGP